MANTSTVLVVGATGNVGSTLIPLLCAAGVQVRALVRDEAKAQPLRDQGVEVVFGDLDRPETLDAAVDGADKVYLITWNGPTGVTHGHNLITAAQRTGRPHIVKQGGYGSPRSRIIQHHWQMEYELRTSGLPYTLLRPTFFMQNAMMGAQTVAAAGVIYMPFKDGRVGMIDVRDIAEAAAAVLTSEGHAGQEYVLTGPASISFHDVAAALSAALSKPVQYVDVPLEAGKQAMLALGMPEWITDGFVELLADFSMNWGDRVSPAVEQLTGRPGRSIDEFARDFAAVFGRTPVAVGA
jgi:uncharacterized protein YbjT (DUF2867 family)